MIQDLEINTKNIPQEQIKSREESLKLFKDKGFPNKRHEDWKFTDLSKIINENFKKITPNKDTNTFFNIVNIKDFKHNSIKLINGFLVSNNFEHEDENNIKITVYKENLTKKINSDNPLINLNDAMFEGGYYLEINNKYKFSKPLVVYNYFSKNLKNTITNNKNIIVLKDESDLNLIEVGMDITKDNFILNNYTNIKIGKNASLKNFTVQLNKSNKFYYKFVKGSISEKGNYEDYIFSSGLKFNKTEQDIDINGTEANCTIQSGLYLDFNSHQEIKTLINHLKPNCTSYQKIKNVLNQGSKGAYQGKIFVKDIAQKTNAYQLSRALLLNDTSEFNAKPELEIYADDVKCSHGSTSGSINEDSIFYLMTRGISRKQAIDLLTKAFLLETVNSIKNIEIKKFIEKNLDRQIYEN